MGESYVYRDSTRTKGHPVREAWISIGPFNKKVQANTPFLIPTNIVEGYLREVRCSPCGRSRSVAQAHRAFEGDDGDYTCRRCGPEAQTYVASVAPPGLMTLEAFEAWEDRRREKTARASEEARYHPGDAEQ